MLARNEWSMLIMSKDILRADPNQLPSYQEFKDTVLQHGAKTGFLNEAANLHGRIPRLLRVLHNLDPTGTLSAFDQLLSEQIAEREQDNILRAIYNLAIKIWNIEAIAYPRLPDDKFEFLYFVYIKSETNRYSRVGVDEIQELSDISQQRAISIGQYLDRNGFIEFRTLVQGIRITHRGVIRVEADLLGRDVLPEYVSEEEIRKIEKRIGLRFAFLKQLNEETEGDTFKRILHTDLAQTLGVEHNSVVIQVLPYLVGEGWIINPTADSVAISEEGIDIVKALLE